jgi:hypothetical protein
MTQMSNGRVVRGHRGTSSVPNYRRCVLQGFADVRKAHKYAGEL